MRKLLLIVGFLFTLGFAAHAEEAPSVCDIAHMEFSDNGQYFLAAFFSGGPVISDSVLGSVEELKTYGSLSLGAPVSSGHFLMGNIVVSPPFLARELALADLETGRMKPVPFELGGRRGDVAFRNAVLSNNRYVIRQYVHNDTGEVLAGILDRENMGALRRADHFFDVREPDDYGYASGSLKDSPILRWRADTAWRDLGSSVRTPYVLSDPEMRAYFEGRKSAPLIVDRWEGAKWRRVLAVAEKGVRFVSAFSDDSLGEDFILVTLSAPEMKTTRISIYDFSGRRLSTSVHQSTPEDIRTGYFGAPLWVAVANEDGATTYAPLGPVGKNLLQLLGAEGAFNRIEVLGFIDRASGIAKRGGTQENDTQIVFFDLAKGAVENIASCESF